MRILGITADVTTCECCGRTNLKKTVALETDGRQVHFGVDCAALAMRGSKKSRERKAVESEASAMSLAAKWVAAGHSVEAVCQGIWNRFGFLPGLVAQWLSPKGA